ncbi:MAG: methyltransferase domain-containing protein [Acidobacteria bacterium]|nr:MAG: methyltransferase domain-containing protein [Acidobacteriota bacterium]
MIATALFQAITVLVHGTLIDGTGAAPRVDAVVEMRDGTITAIARAESYVVPEGASVIDVTGKWVLPGYIDTHTHLLDSGSLYTSPDDYDLTDRVPHESERRRIREGIPATLEHYRCSGVTTLASLGGPRWELEVARTSEAPRVLTSGPFFANFPVLDVTLWTRDDPVLVQLKSVDDARAKVRDVANQGVDLIKVGYAGPPGAREAFRPILEALVEASHALGLRVAMHAEELETAKMAIRAGVDVLAHTIVDQVVDSEFLDLAKESGVVTISGLGHFDRYREVLDSAVSLLPIERRCGDRRVIASWDTLAAIPRAERPPVPDAIEWGSGEEAREILLTNMRKMFEAGIPIAAGSNGGNIGTLQGPSFHREFHKMAEAGLPLEAIIASATRDAARALGLEDRGTLTPGKRGDLVVLGEDPLEHVSHLAAIDFVMAGGQLVGAPKRVPAEPMSYRGALWLEREDRYFEERPDLVLEAMALEPGDVVADIGTGSGYYARQMAPLVAPGGRVLAVDIQPQMLKFLSQLVEEEGITGVEPILSEPDDPKLPAGELDWILLADVYHEIAEPEKVLSKMREALAPDGRVALLEYRVEDGTGDRLKADHAMSVRQVLSEWKPAGFDLVALDESLPMQHLFVFAVEGGEHTIEDVDFLDALAVEVVEAEIESSGAVRIRRKTARPIVVTLPVGTYLEAQDEKGSLFARRDAFVFLESDDWYLWDLRRVGRERTKPPGDRFEMRRPSAVPALANLLRVIQVGTYALDGLRYPPRTEIIEQAAIWIADEDASYAEMLEDIGGTRIPPAYVAAFALVFCDAAGIDVTTRRIWEDAELIFEPVREAWLKDFYARRAE